MKQILMALVVAVLATMGVPEKVKLPPTHPTMIAAEGCVDDVVAAAEAECPAAERATCARLAFVIAMQESGCRADPKCPPGPQCNDDGAACGAMQVHEPWKIVAGATCEKVRADRRLGLRVGMRLLRDLGRRCATIGLALSAYATGGACAKVDVARSLMRCRVAGVDCAAAWPAAAAK